MCGEIYRYPTCNQYKRGEKTPFDNLPIPGLFFGVGKYLKDAMGEANYFLHALTSDIVTGSDDQIFPQVMFPSGEIFNVIFNPQTKHVEVALEYDQNTFPYNPSKLSPYVEFSIPIVKFEKVINHLNTKYPHRKLEIDRENQTIIWDSWRTKSQCSLIFKEGQPFDLRVKKIEN